MEYCPEGLIYEYCVYQKQPGSLDPIFPLQSAFVKCINTSQSSSKDHRERILAYCGWRGQDYFVSHAYSAEVAIKEAVQVWTEKKVAWR